MAKRLRSLADTFGGVRVSPIRSCCRPERMTQTDVTVVEVGPRDGLQSVEQTMSDGGEVPLDRRARRCRIAPHTGRLVRLSACAAADGRLCGCRTSRVDHSGPAGVGARAEPSLRPARLRCRRACPDDPGVRERAALDREHPQDPRRDHRGRSRDRRVARRAVSEIRRSRSALRPPSDARSRASFPRTT